MSSHARARRSLRTTAMAAGIAALGVGFAGHAIAEPQPSEALEGSPVSGPTLPDSSTIQGLAPQTGGSADPSELFETLGLFEVPAINNMSEPTADDAPSDTRLSSTSDTSTGSSSTDADMNSTSVGEDGEPGLQGLPAEVPATLVEALATVSALQPEDTADQGAQGADGEPGQRLSVDRVSADGLTENRMNDAELTTSPSIDSTALVDDMVAELLAL